MRLNMNLCIWRCAPQIGSRKLLIPMLYKNIVILMGLTLTSQSIYSAPLHKDSLLLARCEFVYAYAGQTMQLRNNIGAATNILRRSAFLSVANMMLNEEGGVISGWKIEEWKSLRPALKRDLDTGALDFLKESAVCDKKALPIASAVRDGRPSLWGKGFDELHDAFYMKLKTAAGL